MRGRPVLDHQLQAEQIGEFQEPLDGEVAGVRFDLGQAVLAERQLGGQRTLRELGSAPPRRENLSKLGAMGQDLFRGSTFIGIGDKRNISVSVINVNYRFSRYQYGLWQVSRIALPVLACGIATVNAALGDDLRGRNDVARGPAPHWETRRP